MLYETLKNFMLGLQSVALRRRQRCHISDHRRLTGEGVPSMFGMQISFAHSFRPFQPMSAEFLHRPARNLRAPPGSPTPRAGEWIAVEKIIFPKGDRCTWQRNRRDVTNLVMVTHLRPFFFVVEEDDDDCPVKTAATICESCSLTNVNQSSFVLSIC